MEHRANLICKICMCDSTDVKQILKFSRKPLFVNEVMPTCASIQAQKLDDISEEMCSKYLNLEQNEIKIKTECDEIYIEDTNILNLGNLEMYLKEEEGEIETKPVSFKECDLVHLDDSLDIGASDTKNDELTISVKEKRSYKIKKPVNKKHNKLHELFQCYVCNKQFRLKYHLAQHVQVHSKLKAFKCDICNKEFRRECGLKAHKQNIHLDIREKLYKCDVCSKKFYIVGALKRHMKTHIREKTFKCDLCDSKFTQEFYLNLHKQRHFKCDGCCKDFYTADVLKTHRKHCRF